VRFIDVQISIIKKPAILLAFVFLWGVISSCSNNQPLKQSINCVETTQGHSTKPPCWLLHHPSEYIKVGGSKHLGSNGWLKAKQQLLKEAMLEIATRRYGEEVAIKTLVVKEVKDNTQEGVSAKTRTVREAQFNTGDQAIKVKASVKDYYYDVNIDKVWILVKEE
jgi:hypothetical protein